MYSDASRRVYATCVSAVISWTAFNCVFILTIVKGVSILDAFKCDHSFDRTQARLENAPERSDDFKRIQMRPRNAAERGDYFERVQLRFYFYNYETRF